MVKVITERPARTVGENESATGVDDGSNGTDWEPNTTGGLPPGNDDGDVLTWDGDSWEPEAPGTGTGGRPPFSIVVAADDSDSALQAIADYVCDGTADDVEINAALADAAGSGVDETILLLPGTYVIADSIDFTGFTGSTGRLVFDARATVIRAGANLTTMVDLGPSSGGQILGKLDLAFGQLDGNAGSYTVTQAVYMRRFSDNRLFIHDIYNVTGRGVFADQVGVSDYGCFNNDIEIIRLNEIDGTAFYAAGDTSAYGFQGNTIRAHQTAYNGDGFIMDATVNHNSTYNTFILGPVEHNGGYGIYDRAGANTWLVSNLNTHGTNAIGCPTSMALRSTFIVNVDAGSGDDIDAAVLDQHYVIDNGQFRSPVRIAERASAPATPASGFGAIYFKTDGKPYAKNDSGTEYDMSGGASFATPAIVLGTSGAAGAASTVIRSDSTIAAFDATVPVTQAFGDAAATGSVAFAARRDHVHGMPSAPSGVTDHFHIVDEQFSGDASTTVFYLANEAVPDTVMAYVAGTRTPVTLGGSMNDEITFGSAPGSGTLNISVDYAAVSA